eukprot:1050664-Pyramimonas_sp.AAC.1
MTPLTSLRDSMFCTQFEPRCANDARLLAELGFGERLRLIPAVAIDRRELILCARKTAAPTEQPRRPWWRSHQLRSCASWP